MNWSRLDPRLGTSTRIVVYSMDGVFVYIGTFSEDRSIVRLWHEGSMITVDAGAPWPSDHWWIDAPLVC